MDVLTSETCWAVNNEIINQVTSSWSLFIQLSRRSNKHIFFLIKQLGTNQHNSVPMRVMSCICFTQSVYWTMKHPRVKSNLKWQWWSTGTPNRILMSSPWQKLMFTRCFKLLAYTTNFSPHCLFVYLSFYCLTSFFFLLRKVTVELFPPRSSVSTVEWCLACVSWLLPPLPHQNCQWRTSG